MGDPDKDTVEFRQCNGTLDGRVVQAFCRLCAALAGAARWQPEAARQEAEPLGSHHLRVQVSDTAACADAGTDPAPLWRFLQAVCPDGLPADAAASLLWLFRRGSWQPNLETLAAN